MTYSCSQTTRYKQGFIHSAIVNGHEVVRVQVDAYAYVLQVKSYQAAKIAITKHAQKYGGK